MPTRFAKYSGWLLAAAVLLWVGFPVIARSVSRAPAPGQGAASGTAAKAVTAANALLATLSDAEKARTLFPFDSPQRSNWSNLPSGIYQRHSLKLGDVTPAQRAAAMALMEVVLSREGYKKAVDIMNGDEVLKNNGRGGGPPFGLAEYFIAILGTPSATTPWMVQFGGHHLALNVTIVGASNVLTPSLPAAQPSAYTLNGQSIRPLGDEYDKGFALINALNAEQQKQAILPSRVSDLVLGAGQDGKTIQPEGLPASAMTPAQQEMLFDLAREWVGILNDEGAAAKMKELRANLAKTYFAWSGPTTAGSVSYYRIQGPTVVIEFAPQKTVDHIHTIYRDPTNDYGARLVGK